MTVEDLLLSTKNASQIHIEWTSSLMFVADFSRSDYSGPPLTDLVEIIEYAKPTALLGLSTIKVALCDYFYY